jgi:hypothetical protein
VCKLNGVTPEKKGEHAAEGEMDDHLGSAKHDPARRDGGNSRNGTRTKQLLTDVRLSRRSWASANAASPRSTDW